MLLPFGGSCNHRRARSRTAPAFMKKPAANHTHYLLPSSLARNPDTAPNRGAVMNNQTIILPQAAWFGPINPTATSCGATTPLARARLGAVDQQGPFGAEGEQLFGVAEPFPGVDLRRWRGVRDTPVRDLGKASLAEQPGPLFGR